MLNENFPANIHEAQEIAEKEERDFEHECKKGDDFYHEQKLKEIEDDIPRPVCLRYEDLECEFCGLINNAQCEKGVDYLIEVEGKEKGNPKCSECGSYDTDTMFQDKCHGKPDIAGLVPLKYICNRCGREENL